MTLARNFAYYGKTIPCLGVIGYFLIFMRFNKGLTEGLWNTVLKLPKASPTTKLLQQNGKIKLKNTPELKNQTLVESWRPFFCLWLGIWMIQGVNDLQLVQRNKWMKSGSIWKILKRLILVSNWKVRYLQLWSAITLLI